MNGVRLLATSSGKVVRSDAVKWRTGSVGDTGIRRTWAAVRRRDVSSFLASCASPATKCFQSSACAHTFPDLQTTNSTGISLTTLLYTYVHQHLGWLTVHYTYFIFSLQWSYRRSCIDGWRSGDASRPCPAGRMPASSRWWRWSPCWRAAR